MSIDKRTGPTVAQKLREAAEILERKEWITGMLFVREKLGEEPTSCCVLGALRLAVHGPTGNLRGGQAADQRVASESVLGSCWSALAKAIDPGFDPSAEPALDDWDLVGNSAPSVCVRFNDERATSKRQVIEKLIEAADLVEKEQT